MEYCGYDQQHGFLEELLAMRSDSWEATTSTTVPMAMNDFLYNDGWNQMDYWVDNSLSVPQISSCFDGFSNLPIEQSLNCSFNELYCSFGDELSPPEFTDSSYNNKLDTPPFPSQEDLSIMDDEDQGLLENCLQNNLEMRVPSCKLEPTQSSAEGPSAFSMGICPAEKRNKSKKLNGQPSKNLMAERRRRKRLNDRLSMLRSVVPKISKMDRTSILGDTIDYMKELLERINNLQEEMEMSGSNQPSLMGIFKESKPNEVLVRNSPKFDVERRNSDTRIEICCAGKPGLLLSTLTTLEALGLEIQQCVISCFNDFAVQASCSEELEQREILSSDDIKQALFRNAGYGGRCL